jgi:hypothetical protein
MASVVPSTAYLHFPPFQNRLDSVKLFPLLHQIPSVFSLVGFDKPAPCVTLRPPTALAPERKALTYIRFVCSSYAMADPQHVEILKQGTQAWNQ